MIDFNLNGDGPICTSEKDLIFQQMDILYDTHNKDVLGHEWYGTQYDEYLYDTQISAESLEEKVYNDLNSLELFGYVPQVSVSLHEGTEQDIALIAITLTRYDDTQTRIYKISK